MPEMQFDFDGLIQLLAGALYSEKSVFIRELIQNGHDAVKRRQATERAGYGGRIDIESRPAELRIAFRDNGVGMNRGDLEDYLASIGKSFTRLKRHEVEGLVGQFGIGFLSAFVVAKRVEVLTRKLGEEQGWRWENSGSKAYSLEPWSIDSPGTTVEVYLKGEEFKGVIDEEEVQDTVRKYCDMLQVPIHLNKAIAPINTMHMPWERTGMSAEEMRFECLLYLEKRVPDSVLEVIPVKLVEPIRVEGVLYITRWRVVAIDSPRTVQLFESRLFICSDATELLPKWATFVNGIINSPDVSPTAARDNFLRNDASRTLRDALGNAIIKHLEALHESKPDRFSEIQHYHNLAIKAACFYHEDFFAKFAQLLEWRTNSGIPSDRPESAKPIWKTLPQILNGIVAGSTGSQQLACFTTGNSANQYFEMANAAGTMVADASYQFEDKLLEYYVKLPGVNVELVHVDRVDDPGVFKPLSGEADDPVRKLAEAMARTIHIGGHGLLRTDARHFYPSELPAVIRSDARSRAQNKAQQILSDPNSSRDLREMAEEMDRLSRNSSLKLTINAENALIRRLSRQDFANPDVMEIMTGLYNSAILVNQELMTPTNARLFYKQFQRLMNRALEFIETADDLSKARVTIEREHERLRANRPKPKHRIVFMMTPFSARYHPVIAALRSVLEDEFGCQLYLASDIQYEDRILDNIRKHMEIADAFVAELTEADPNVMFELGAAYADHGRQPVIKLVDGEASEASPRLPADLGSMIYINYGGKQGTALTAFLSVEIRKHDKLVQVLEDSSRERYISPRTLMAKTKLGLSSNTFDRLAARFPTIESWKRARKAEVAEILGPDSDFAEFLLQRVANLA